MQNEYLKQVIRRNANHASPDPSDPQVDSWTALGAFLLPLGTMFLLPCRGEADAVLLGFDDIAGC